MLILKFIYKTIFAQHLLERQISYVIASNSNNWMLKWLKLLQVLMMSSFDNLRILYSGVRWIGEGWKGRIQYSYW
jgi:hypothetical protein